jgi:hypothetical protein
MRGAGVMLRGKGACCAALMLFFSLTAPFALPATAKDLPEGPVTIEADRVTYERDEDTVSASGKVLITFTGGILKADKVTLFRSANKALAEGNVYLRSDRTFLKASGLPLTSAPGRVRSITGRCSSPRTISTSTGRRSKSGGRLFTTSKMRR